MEEADATGDLVYAGKKFWVRGDIKGFDLNTEVTDQIKADVYDWLGDDKADHVLTFNLYNESGKWVNLINFSRAEINVKACHNVWSVWRIATCDHPPIQVSRFVREIGTNEFFEDCFSLPNEVRSGNYGPGSKFSAFS